MDDHTYIRPKLVTIKGTMHQIPVKRTTIYGLIDDGTLVRVKVGARTLITQESIDAYITRLTATAR